MFIFFFVIFIHVIREKFSFECLFIKLGIQTHLLCFIFSIFVILYVGSLIKEIATLNKF